MGIIRTKVWAHDSWVGDEYSYSLNDVDMSENGWIHVEDVEVFFQEPTREELIVGNIASLRKEREALIRKQVAAVRDIDERIQNLLAITMDEGVRS